MKDKGQNVQSAKPATRYLVSLNVSSEKYGSAAKSNFRMRNLSRSGALLYILKSSESFKKGDILRLAVNLEQLKKIKVLSAEVIWTNKSKVGVCFIKPTEVLPKLFELY
jgi:hypothetical protein